MSSGLLGTSQRTTALWCTPLAYIDSHSLWLQLQATASALLCFKQSEVGFHTGFGCLNPVCPLNCAFGWTSSSHSHDGYLGCVLN